MYIATHSARLCYIRTFFILCFIYISYVHFAMHNPLVCKGNIAILGTGVQDQRS